MKTFLKWLAEINPEEATLLEKTKRNIAYWAYPPLYASGQYPPYYFTPIKAGALQALGLTGKKKKKNKKPKKD